MRKGLLRSSCCVAAVLVLPGGSNASETRTYSYDSLGRLVLTSVANGPNNGIAAAACLDGAGNRTRYIVGAGVTTCGSGGTPTPSPTPAPTGNRPPVATTDNISLNCNSGGGYNLLANDTDPDGDTISLTSVHSNGGFTISVANSTQGIAGVSSGRTTGTYSGTYVVTDSKGAASTGNVNVVINHGGPGGC